jgi:hypothetical protein
MIDSLVNSEFLKDGEESCYKVIWDNIYWDGLRKVMETLVQVASFLSDILTRNLPNTKQDS